MQAYSSSWSSKVGLSCTVSKCCFGYKIISHLPITSDSSPPIVLLLQLATFCSCHNTLGPHVWVTESCSWLPLYKEEEVEYPELEGLTHRDQVQILALPRTLGV